MNRVAVFAGGLLLLVGALFFFFSSDEGILPYVPETAGLPTITVGGTRVIVDVADTQEERERGLSGRSVLPGNRGMLFIFEQDDLYKIWMKDMLFPLDIFWIDADGVIVEMKTGVSPDTYPTIFGSKVPVRYILEVPSGFAEQYNVEIGTRVEL